MPTVTETPAQLLAFCQDPRCRGSAQTAVEGIEVVAEWTYREQGAKRPGVEKSTVSHRFANEADSVCKSCGKTRAIGDQPRPAYEPLSGHDPNGLLNVDGWSPAGRSAAVEQMVDALARKLTTDG